MINLFTVIFLFKFNKSKIILSNVKKIVYKKAIFFRYLTLYKYKRKTKKREKTLHQYHFTTTIPED